jgi:pyroglutamyl-peptidase
MRLLIYGFGPYRQFRYNITAKIIGSLPKRPGLSTIVFPVRYHRRQFIEAIECYGPDCILGLGQSSRERLEIESRAINWRRNSETAPQRAIYKHKPKYLLTTLDVMGGREAGKSENAGDYVCNYSMYVVLDYIASKKLNIPFGFIHIPHDHDPRRATRFVEKIIGRVSGFADRKSAAKSNLQARRTRKG